MSRAFRIGEILIEQKVLSEQQVFEIVAAQKKLHLPFGVLAERMFEVSLESIEEAWVEQYHRVTGTLNLAEQRVDEAALATITRRQAWQFEILPLHFEDTGELVVAASRKRLARAVTFAANRIDHVVYFRVAESHELQHWLEQYYAMPMITDRWIEKARQLGAGHAKSA